MDPVSKSPLTRTLVEPVASDPPVASATKLSAATSVASRRVLMGLPPEPLMQTPAPWQIVASVSTAGCGSSDERGVHWVVLDRLRIGQAMGAEQAGDRPGHERLIRLAVRARVHHDDAVVGAQADVQP